MTMTLSAEFWRARRGGVCGGGKGLGEARGNIVRSSDGERWCKGEPCATGDEGRDKGEAGGELRTEDATELGDEAGPEEATGKSTVIDNPTEVAEPTAGTGEGEDKARVPSGRAEVVAEAGVGDLGCSSLPSPSVMTMTPSAESVTQSPMVTRPAPRSLKLRCGGVRGGGNGLGDPRSEIVT
jgi:hypothetical protein